MVFVFLSCVCVVLVSALVLLVVTTMPLLRIPTLSKAAVNFERWLIMFMGALLDDVEITGSRRAPRHALDRASGRGLTNPPAHAARLPYTRRGAVANRNSAISRRPIRSSFLHNPP